MPRGTTLKWRDRGCLGEGSVPDDTTSDCVQSSVACSADIDLARPRLLLRRSRVRDVIRRQIQRTPDLHLILGRLRCLQFSA